jgi:predicted NBD/HSP70 family sugar kinase
MSGEIGHISIDPDGLPCECGHRGCIEAYYKRALAEGNGDEVLRLLARAAAIAVNLYDPSMLLCLGSVMDGMDDEMFGRLGDMIRAGALHGEERSLQLKRSQSRECAAVAGLNEIVFSQNCGKLFG